MLKYLSISSVKQRVQRQQIFLYALLIWLAVVEIIVYLVPQVGHLGFWSWIASWLVMTIVLARPIGELLGGFWNRNQYGWFIALGILMAVWGGLLFSPRTVGGESTQEIGCALFFLEKPHAGYQETCLFGYPTRQYYLPALPSLLFGRSLFSLNLGNSFYLWLGVFACLAGIWQYWRYNKRVGMGLFVVVAALPQFYYFHHFFYFRFEQSIFPFAFGLLGIGLWLLYKAQSEQKYLLLMVLWLYHIAFAYTPALSLVPVGLVALCLALWETFQRTTKQNRLPWWSTWVSLLVVGVVGGVISMLKRHDINLLGTQEGHTENPVQSLGEVFGVFLKPDIDKAFFSPVMQFGFWGILAWLLIGKKRWWSWLLVAWVLLTILACTLAKGYAFYQIEFRLHRAMVVMPIVIVAMVVWVMETPLRLSKLHTHIVAAIIIFSAIWQFYNYAHATEVEKNYILATELHREINPDFTAERPREIVFVADKYSVYRSINDWLKYFDEDIQVQFLDINKPCLLPPKTEYVFVPSDSDCSMRWQEKNWYKKTTWMTREGWQGDLLEKPL